jgi:uncharacterized membrane protein
MWCRNSVVLVTQGDRLLSRSLIAVDQVKGLTEWYLAFSLIGVGLCTWIAIRSRGAAGLPGCGNGSGCATLASSRWSRCAGVPLAALGAFSYLATAILCGSLLLGWAGGSVRQGLLGLAILLAGAAVWFSIVQVVIVRRFCLYCNLIHACGLIVLALVLIDLHRNNLSSSGLGSSAAVAFGALLLLVGGQLLWPQKTYALVAASDYQPVESTVPRAETSPGRKVILLNGQIRLKDADWPLIGTGNAEQLIGLFFDYTCPTCRTVHANVVEVVRRHPSRLGVLILPIPQHPGCNERIKKVVHGHGYACQYARLAIALWQARPDLYQQFDDYLSAEAEIPPLGSAMRRAKELAGVDIDPHKPDEAADQVIRRAIDLYLTMPVKKVPTLLLPSASLVGRIDSASELEAVLGISLARVRR